MPLPIVTRGPVTQRRLSIFDFDTSMRSAVAASVTEAWLFNPTNAMTRWAELDAAQYGEPERRFIPGEGFTFRRRERTSPIIPAEQARQIVKDNHLDLNVPDEGISYAALRILMERKREELARQLVLARAPDGALPLQMAAALAVSLVDPINIGSAFIPVVAPARYTALLAKASSTVGRAVVRTRIGALEGAVGAAIVEPLVYGAARAEQADYGLMDSLLNVAFGTVLGGGLHAGAGAVADAFGRAAKGGDPRITPQGDTARAIDSLPADVRFNALRASVAEVATDRYPTVEAFIPVSRTPTVRVEVEAKVREQVLREAREQLLPDAGARLSRGDRQQLQAERADLDFRLERLETRENFQETAKRIQRTERKTRKQAESEARKRIAQDKADLLEKRARVQKQLEADAARRDAEADLSRIEQGHLPERLTREIQQRTDEQMATLQGRRELREGAARALRGRVDGTSLREAIQRSHSVENDIVLDTRAADELTARIEQLPESVDEATVDAELADYLEDVDRLGELMGLEDPRAAINVDAEAVTKAQALGKAVRDLAACRTG